MFRESWKTKKRQIQVFCSGIPKYVTSRVIYGNLYFVSVCHHNGITQRPHDDLFQKSGHLGATCTAKAGKQKTSNSGFPVVAFRNTLTVG